MDVKRQTARFVSYQIMVDSYAFLYLISKALQWKTDSHKHYTETKRMAEKWSADRTQENHKQINITYMYSIRGWLSDGMSKC